jgi:hypothetical protein
MINATSRYSQSSLATLQYESQDVAVIVPSQQTAYSFNFIWYQITALDRLDQLSYNFFLDPTQWWRIADANPEILNWNVLPVGAIIRIPTT